MQEREMEKRRKERCGICGRDINERLSITEDGCCGKCGAKLCIDLKDMERNRLH